MIPAKRSGTSKRRRIKASELETLVAEATVDAYGESEQVTSLFTMIEEHLALPFETMLLGVVPVEKLDLTARETTSSRSAAEIDSARRYLSAICRSG